LKVAHKEGLALIFWKRYTDDIFFVWPHGATTLQTFFEKCWYVFGWVRAMVQNRIVTVWSSCAPRQAYYELVVV